MIDTLTLYGHPFHSRLLLGTASYPSPTVLKEAVTLTQPAMITTALRRQGVAGAENGQAFWSLLQDMAAPILPNTAGCFDVTEAITTAHMAREVFNTNWIKLELLGDDDTLQPDMQKLALAAEQLIKDGFYVLPYCTEDLVACRRLLDVGCQVLMPWAAPIGTGKGPVNPYGLQLLRQRLPSTPLIIDAGIGLPSHACQVMEWGFDAVLLNTAVSKAGDPVIMAQAFAQAINAGRAAYLASPMAERQAAQASTPTVGMPFWHTQ
ncbi:MAG: thiazole synthase [Neisseriaceae bacterium]|nr:thiazole synthase [Neisseriaceae bacterium]